MKATRSSRIYKTYHPITERLSVMKIASIHPFILHSPLTSGFHFDSTHSITHWGVVGTKIVTTDGLEGYGLLART